MFVRPPDHAEAIGLKRVLSKVAKVLPDRHEVELADGARVGYDRLLLATGATAVPPPFPGGDLAGVLVLDSLDEARRMIALARKGRTAVVVGGGITALELAEGLAVRGMTVRYFLRAARYWADILDEVESATIIRRLRDHGIDVRTDTQVAKAVGVGGRLTALETADGKTVPCDMAAVAIGVRPRSRIGHGGRTGRRARRGRR